MKTFQLIIIIYFACWSNAFSKINNSHAIAMHGSPKYDSNFLHVKYANPNSLKQGSIVRSSFGSYDSFNPFILKGTSAAGIGTIFETLTPAAGSNSLRVTTGP